jgi:uncharacterized protein YjbJ (UPF0337 family)
MTERGDRDRIEGTFNEAKGEVKQAWGEATDDERTRMEGVGDELKGKAQQAWGDVKDKAEDLKEDIDRAI